MIVTNEQEYLELDEEQIYIASADVTKMNDRQRAVDRVKHGGMYGDIVMASMYKRDIRDFLSAGVEIIDGVETTTGIGTFSEIEFLTREEAQAKVKQFNLDNPSEV